MDDIINGQINLRNALTSCDDPLKAIEAFQVSFLVTKIDFPIFSIFCLVSVEKWSFLLVIAANAAPS